MQRVPVGVELSVGARGRQLGGDGEDLGRRREDAVEADDAAHLGPGPCEVEDAEPAEAVADRGDSAAVDRGMAAGRVEAGEM